MSGAVAARRDRRGLTSEVVEGVEGLRVVLRRLAGAEAAWLDELREAWLLASRVAERLAELGLLERDDLWVDVEELGRLDIPAARLEVSGLTVWLPFLGWNGTSVGLPERGLERVVGGGRRLTDWVVESESGPVVLVGIGAVPADLLLSILESIPARYGVPVERRAEDELEAERLSAGAGEWAQPPPEVERLLCRAEDGARFGVPLMALAGACGLAAYVASLAGRAPSPRELAALGAPAGAAWPLSRIVAGLSRDMEGPPARDAWERHAWEPALIRALESLHLGPEEATASALALLRWSVAAGRGLLERYRDRLARLLAIERALKAMGVVLLET